MSNETLSQVVVDADEAGRARRRGRIGGPVTMQAEMFSDLPHEIALRLLGQAIAWAGDEGPVELGKLEALYEAMFEPPDQFAKFRRTLAGAVVTVAGGQNHHRTRPRRARRA